MKILFAAAPGYGLMLPIVPLVWAARAAGHEVLLATTSEMTEVGASAGLPVTDVYPEHDLWQVLMDSVATKMAAAHGKAPEPESEPEPAAESNDEMSALFRRATEAGSPFGLFTLTMTEGTITAGRDFGADLVVCTSDHAAGMLTARALGVGCLEVGNRVSWSMRDADFRENHSVFDDDEITSSLREQLDIPEGAPNVLARIDPRAPSMGGLTADEPDARDGIAWWPMRYVPYNGGAVLPEWTRRVPERPRIGVTLGTVVPAITGTSNLSATIEALGGMDVDVILAAKESDLTDLGGLPDNVHPTGYLPLSGFLPTCSLLVHHGGSGTTAAPLHYGVPQLVFPAFADNPMAAERVMRRGVGLSHDPSTVDVETVRKLVTRILDEPEFAAAAREVSAEMATQPSPATIIERVTELVSRDSAKTST